MYIQIHMHIYAYIIIYIYITLNSFDPQKSKSWNQKKCVPSPTGPTRQAHHQPASFRHRRSSARPDPVTHGVQAGKLPGKTAQNEALRLFFWFEAKPGIRL